MRRILAVLMLVLLGPAEAELQTRSFRQVKVVLEFRQSSAQSRDAAQGSGRVIITDRGSPRASGGITGESTSRTVTRSTGIFTIVQDGGESTLLVASQVPYVEVTYYRDYLARTGHLAAGVTFKEIGTALKVRATVLPDSQVRVRLTPTISWFADDRSGAIEVQEASTELVVPNGRSVAIGGATTRIDELTRQILGVAASRSSSESLFTLTAIVRD
jgi:Bacterial type II and III secretion system protein